MVAEKDRTRDTHKHVKFDVLMCVFMCVLVHASVVFLFAHNTLVFACVASHTITVTYKYYVNIYPDWRYETTVQRNAEQEGGKT